MASVTSIALQKDGGVQCESAVANLDQLAALAPGHIIFVGELHGTDVTPQVFGELVCRVSAPGQKLLVGLEFPAAIQTSLDTYLLSEGSAQDQIVFFDDPKKFWSSEGYIDGRSSEAMFAMVEKLRRLKAAGVQIDVVAFQSATGSTRDGSETQEPYEMRLANLYMDQWNSENYDAGLILVGNIHAIKSPVKGSRGTFKPMATHMPHELVLTFNALSARGSAWNCQADGCGSHSFPLYPATRLPARVEFEADDRYDGVIYVGRSIASPPIAHR